jgi:hypothetical protein
MTQMATLNGSGQLLKLALGIAVTIGFGVASIYGVWITNVDARVQVHDSKDFHDPVRGLVTAAVTAEREWNEAEHWKQEQRFDGQFLEVRAEMSEQRRALAEAITLMRVLEERSRPDE